jgi:integrase
VCRIALLRIKIRTFIYEEICSFPSFIFRFVGPPLAYTCSRIGAVVSLRVQDYFQNGQRSVVRLRTKGGKEKEFPVHHLLEDILDAYLDISGLRTHPAGPLFPTTRGNSRELGSRPMTRIDAPGC